MKKTVLVIADKPGSKEMTRLLSSLNVDIARATDERMIRRICRRRDITVAVFDDDTFRGRSERAHSRIVKALQGSGKDFIYVSSCVSPSDVSEVKEIGASDYIVKPYSCREFIARFNAVTEHKVRIACIGGGTGLFHLLVGLKTLPRTMLTSVVSVSDEGGSSGRLMTSFGILPPGDIRRSLVALSNIPEIMSDVMQYRFQKGGA